MWYSFFFRGIKILKLESPKASFAAGKSKWFGIFFKVTYPSGWAQQLANCTETKNNDTIHATSHYDAPVPSFWNLSLTFYSNAPGGEVKDEGS
jgi:hypothetical protein